MSFTFPYETVTEDVAIGGVSLRLEKLRSLDDTIDGFFALYEKTGREELFEDLCPYFGVPWPAGSALAARVVREAPRWENRKVTELACGLALPTLVLAKLGVGGVTATDLHPDVPEFFRRNLAHNGLGAHYRHLDWRSSAVATDILLASDLVYDRRQPDTLLAFLERSTWREVWLADPDRPHWDGFVRAARARFAAEEFREEKIRYLKLTR